MRVEIRIILDFCKGNGGKKCFQGKLRVSRGSGRLFRMVHGHTLHP